MGSGVIAHSTAPKQLRIWREDATMGPHPVLLDTGTLGTLTAASEFGRVLRPPGLQRSLRRREWPPQGLEAGAGQERVRAVSAADRVGGT